MVNYTYVCAVEYSPEVDYVQSRERKGFPMAFQYL